MFFLSKAGKIVVVGKGKNNRRQSVNREVTKNDDSREGQEPMSKVTPMLQDKGLQLMS